MMTQILTVSTIGNITTVNSTVGGMACEDVIYVFSLLAYNSTYVW